MAPRLHTTRRASRPAPPVTPRPAEIVRARARARLTQREAGALIHTTDRVWRQYEAGDRGMHPAFWELFRLKARAGGSL